MKYETAKATEKVRDRIIDLVISATEHVIEERITTEDDRRIVGDFLANIDRIGK